MSKTFFSDLPAVPSTRQTVELSYYRPVPDDWVMIVTDVRGSTKAIEKGLYKQVNTVGVSSLIAIQNACGNIRVPLIFGGDGATAFVPPECVEQCQKALKSTQIKSQAEFGFELRVAFVPMKIIRSHQHEVKIARLQLAGQSSLALAQGTGLAFGEWLAKKTKDYDLKSDFALENAHDGLMCRWNPITSSQGTMLCLIVEAPTPENYILLQRELEKVIPHPFVVTPQTLSTRWPPAHLRQELKMRHSWIVQIMLYPLLLIWLAF